MSALYSAADLVISRSGALVLSEMALMKKAMVLIPLPKSANNHQKLNAKTFSDIGAAIIINQHDLNSEILENTVLNLLKQRSKIKKMEDNSGKLAIPNATEKIFNEIFKMVSI